jgi:hypothetical protein
MKRLLTAALAAIVLASLASEAKAVVCAAGVHRAGCVGRHGAVVVGRPVHRHHCYYRAGVRVCR